MIGKCCSLSRRLLVFVQFDGDLGLMGQVGYGQYGSRVTVLEYLSSGCNSHGLTKSQLLYCRGGDQKSNAFAPASPSLPPAGHLILSDQSRCGHPFEALLVFGLPWSPKGQGLPERTRRDE